MVWYCHLLKNFPQFVVIHIIKDFNIVNEAEVDVFLEFSCYFCDLTDVGNLISDSSDFLFQLEYLEFLSSHTFVQVSVVATHGLSSCGTWA